MSYIWLVGCMISLIGSIASNFGVNLQKWSFMKNEMKTIEQQKTYWKQKYWLVGLLFVIFGGFCDFAALSMAAQSIIAPIGSLNLVVNLLFAHYWLHESLTRRDIMGTILLCVGSTLSVIFGNHSDTRRTADELRAMYGTTLYLVYACLLIASTAVMMGLVYWLTPMRQHLFTQLQIVSELTVVQRALQASHDTDEKEKDKEKDEIVDKCDVKTVTMELETAKQQVLLLESTYSRWHKLHPLCYCGIAGNVGSTSLLLAKSCSELLSVTLEGDNQFTSVWIYIFIAGLGLSLFGQMHAFAMALSYFDAMYVVPVFKCFFLTMSTVGGAAYFQEFSSFGLTQWIFFPFGLALNLLGVYILSAREMSTVTPDTKQKDIDIQQESRPTTPSDEHRKREKEENDVVPMEKIEDVTPLLTPRLTPRQPASDVSVTSSHIAYESSPFPPVRPRITPIRPVSESSIISSTSQLESSSTLTRRLTLMRRNSQLQASPAPLDRCRRGSKWDNLAIFLTPELTRCASIKSPMTQTTYGIPRSSIHVDDISTSHQPSSGGHAMQVIERAVSRASFVAPQQHGRGASHGSGSGWMMTKPEKHERSVSFDQGVVPTATVLTPWRDDHSHHSIIPIDPYPSSLNVIGEANEMMSMKSTSRSVDVDDMP